MSTQLDALPIEMLAHVALFLDRNRQYRNLSVRRDNSLLALRSVSRACLDAARRAIKSHPKTNEFSFHSRTNARLITTVGAVLGSGCQRLTYSGSYGNPQPTPREVLNALRQFVVETRGGLRELSLSGSSISAQLFLEICRACPQLKELSAGYGLPNIASADVDVFAAELSRSCPLLERVNIVRGEILSSAETYAMHFPNLKYLDMGADIGPSYEPSRFDKIEATARRCVRAEELSFNGCTVGAAFAELLIRTPLQSRIKSLYLNESTISQPTLLRLAAGLEALREILFPDNFSASPEFFTSLARARPSLKELQFDEGSTVGDACVAAMCENLDGLETLQIDENNTLTSAVVDIILRSPTAQTLSFVSFYCTPGVNSAGILRLVRGCPRLGQGYWHVQGMTPLGYDSLDGTLHGKNVDDLLALLKERNRGHPNWNFYVDPFKTLGPWKLSEKWRYAHYPNQDA